MPVSKVCIQVHLSGTAVGAMAKKYIKKGGHGGARVGAGLKKGHWYEQGGRVAAAAAKASRLAVPTAAQKQVKAHAWKKMFGPAAQPAHAAVQQEDAPIEAPSEARAAA